MPARAVAYRELADALRQSLRQGRFAEGQALPTELELADSHGVSRQTVRRAMQELVADGVIYRVAGRGTFAVDEPGPYMRHIGSVKDLMGLSQDTQLQVVEPMQTCTDESAVERLSTAGPVVSTLRFTREHEGTVFCLTSVYLPVGVGNLLKDVRVLKTRGARTTDTVIGLLDQRMARPITTAEQVITAVTAPKDVRLHLGASARGAVLRVDRLYKDEAGNAVELAISHFLPEHYSYRVTLRRNPR
ncbi:MAG: hypothetical protein QOE89_3749 [Pseudonocardiales bacterium]|nr:hypothetical protein [Pseudonocardiales bacterium]